MMSKNCQCKTYSVDLWVRGKYEDTFDWFDALSQAKLDAEYRDQEWWDESYGWDDESLMGFTDWEIKIVKSEGDW